MAAQPEEITDSDEDIRSVVDEILRIVRKHDELMEQLRPLIDKYVNNPAARWRHRQ